MTYGQVGSVCPQCGSAAAVHSVEELAAMAQGRLGQHAPGYQPPPGFPSAPASGFPSPSPSQGFPSPSPSPGFPSPPAPPPPPPPPPDYSAGQPPPGYTGQRRPGSRSSGGRPSGTWEGSSWEANSGDSIEDAVAGIVMDAAVKFVGRTIGRRVKRAYDERLAPAMAARQEAMLREQIAIAERHPDLRACLTDQVIFLAGGSRVLPMSSVTRGITLEQADALVAQLRAG
jgi:hypothetical protein